MSGMQIVVTPQGRAALVNAQNTGTLPVTISQVGVTSTAFDATTNPVTLPGELKRIATFAGEVVADDTIHVTMQDDSGDVYSLRGIGLYLQDGTLFASYGQATPIMEKSAQAMVLASMDVRFVQIDATDLTFGDSSFSNPPATTERVGVVELATVEETATGDDQARAITPYSLRALLNSRFGVGAPSAFVKPLLTASTAAAFRTALAIKSAALKDEGAGGGLDADLLDGQHGSYYRAWGNLTGVPALSLDGHVHEASQVTSGVFDVLRIPDLAQSKVTGLTAALAALAPKASPQFSGNVGIGVAGGVPLDVLVGSNRLRFSEDASVATISATNAAASALSTLKFNATTLTRQGNTVWDASNFDPASKANVSGQTFTGNVNVTAAAATAQSTWTRSDVSKSAKMAVESGGVFFGTVSNDALTFITNNTVRGSARSDGVFEWGGVVYSSGGTAGLRFKTQGGGTDWTWFANATGASLDLSGSGPRMAVTNAGEVQAAGGFRNTSSIRVKDIEGPNPYGLAEVLKLETVVGRYKEDFNANSGRRVFLIAENVAAHINGPVSEMAGVTYSGEPVLGLDHGQLFPVLVKAIQELHAEIVALRGAA